MTLADLVAFVQPKLMFAGTYVLLAVFALVIHEAGHILLALALRIRVKRIGISWCGPFIVREHGTPGASAIVALAGPALNLIFAIAYWGAAPLFAKINLALGLSNLMPIRGSDGSHAWLATKSAIAPMSLRD